LLVAVPAVALDCPRTQAVLQRCCKLRSVLILALNGNSAGGYERARTEAIAAVCLESRRKRKRRANTKIASFLWSGDIECLWETLKTHVPNAISTGLSGIRPGVYEDYRHQRARETWFVGICRPPHLPQEYCQTDMLAATSLRDLCPEWRLFNQANFINEDSFSFPNRTLAGGARPTHKLSIICPCLIVASFFVRL
jgi:hypothetical protein